MQKIDTTNWLPFKVGDLFRIKGGKGITKFEISTHEGSLPAIQSGEANFGCIGFIDKDYCISKGYVLSEGECLTVARSGSSGYVGYQASQCVVGDSAKILEPKFEANTLRLLFLRATLMVNKKKYAYIDKVTNENYARDIILLPAIDKDTPNWQYMEDYMRGVDQRVKSVISAMEETHHISKQVNTKSWQEFIIGKLFDVVKGKRLTKADMLLGEINYIGATAFNNGISAKIGNTEELHKEGVITVCYNGSIGQSFFQDNIFWASDDVNVLYPKFVMTPRIAHFICPILRKIGQKFAYVDKWTAEKMRKTKIILPARENEPDWQYMEMFMRGVEAIAKNKIDALQRSKQSVSPTPQTPFTNYGTVNIIDNSRNYNIK